MTIGIDFGFSDVKIVVAEKNPDGNIHITNAGTRPVFVDEKDFDPEKLATAHWTAATQELTAEMGLIPKKIKNPISSISGRNTSVKQLTTLEMDNTELATSLEFEARKHIPMDGTEPVIDFHILGQNELELDKNDVLLIATTKNTILQHDKIKKSTGFKSGVFDSDPISLANAYTHFNELPKDGVDIIINIGNYSTTLIAWGQKHRFFTRELDIAGYHFTKEIMRKRNVDYNAAELIKREEGVKTLTDDGSSNTEVDPLAIKVAELTIFNQLTDELRKTLRYYMKSSNQAFFNKFYISGGSAYVPGLIELIAENLNIEIELLNPFDGSPGFENIENPAQYTVAFGCALRGLVEA